MVEVHLVGVVASNTRDPQVKLSGMSCGVRQRRESPASHRAGTLAEELGRQLCPASRLPEMRGHLQLLSTKQSIPGKSFLTKKWYSNTSTT